MGLETQSDADFINRDRSAVLIPQAFLTRARALPSNGVDLRA